MDRDSHGPLTIEQAKARLRAIARDTTPLGLAQGKPRETLLIALLAGVLVGSVPSQRVALGKGILKLLLD